MKLKTAFLNFFLCFVMSRTAGAQEVPYEIPFLWGYSWGIGARDMGMGGSFAAVGDDYSSLYYNPAAMARIKKTVLHASFSNVGINYNYVIDSPPNETGSTSSYSRLNDIGLCLPIPTSQGSLVFSLGYHRVRQFDSNLLAGGYDILDDGSQKSWEGQLLQQGGLSNTSLGGAMEISPGLFIGAGLHIWGGDCDWTKQYTGPEFLNGYFDSTYTEHVLTEFSGANVSFGTLVTVKDRFRIGVTLVTPITLRAKRTFDWTETFTALEFDPQLKDTFEVDSSYWLDPQTDEYRIQSPWMIRGGISGDIGPVLLSGQIEMANYSQIKFISEPPPNLMSSNKTLANLAIKNRFRNTFNYQVGAEFSLPIREGKLRAGYAFYPSHLKESYFKQDRKVYSFGAGFKFQNQWGVDFAYGFTEWQIPNMYTNVHEKIKAYNLLVSFSYFL
jgi:hypothetical protein